MKSPEGQINSDDDNRDKRADTLLRFLDFAKNIESFKNKKFEEIFDTEEHKREFIDSLTVDDFIELLTGLNGILRDKDKENWTLDGKLVGIPFEGFLSPFIEDKPELLTEVLLATKRMNSEKKDLKDIAVLISSCIGAIHPYIDGNGRSSRFVYQILTENISEEDKKEKLKKLLSDSGRDIIDVSPGYIQDAIDKIIYEKMGVNDKKMNPENILGARGVKIEFRSDVLEEEKDLFINIFRADRTNIFLALFEYLKNNPSKNKYLQKLTSIERHTIRMDILSKDLTKEDLEKIMNDYRNIKKEHVKILIDCLENPDKPEYKIKSGDREIRLKDKIEEEINREEILRKIKEGNK